VESVEADLVLLAAKSRHARTLRRHAERLSLRRVAVHRIGEAQALELWAR
jgi:hypothetical protein